MKKRILLSLVSFFAMTAMWANIDQAYKLTVAGETAKAGTTAELTLSMENKLSIGMWSCTLVLPEGVTFESVTPITARFPEAFGEVEIKSIVNEDGTVALACEGEEGVGVTGTAGAIATIKVNIASDVAAGLYTVTVKDQKLTSTTGTVYDKIDKQEFTWTIEEAAGLKGDLNGDGIVNIADGVLVLDNMASAAPDAKADLNGDGVVNVADFVTILGIMANGQ